MKRRDFLKGAAAGLTLGAPGLAAARPNKTLPPEAVGLLFDATLCIGCKACVAACKEVNGMPPEFSTAEPYWDTPLDLSGRTLNVIKAYVEGTGAVKDRERDGYAFMKYCCLHCVDPSCVSACPVSAMVKDPVTGIVRYDAKACIGCRYCVAACPFGVPRFTYDKALPVISKCQLCAHRMEEGKYAACAEFCPTGATLFGKVIDLKDEARRRLALTPGTETEFPRGRLGSGAFKAAQAMTGATPTRKAEATDTYVGRAARYVDHIYGEKEVGGTQVLRLSGVPFERLALPRLPERSYASVSETLQHTLYGGLIAPLVVFGGLLAIVRRNLKRGEGEEG